MSETLLTDHERIQWWVEEKGGRPAVTRDESDNPHPRLDFSDECDKEGVEPVSWDEFFHLLEEQQLAVLVEEELMDQVNGMPLLVHREGQTIG